MRYHHRPAQEVFSVIVLSVKVLKESIVCSRTTNYVKGRTYRATLNKLSSPNDLPYIEAGLFNCASGNGSTLNSFAGLCPCIAGYVRTKDKIQFRVASSACQNTTYLLRHTAHQIPRSVLRILLLTLSKSSSSLLSSSSTHYLTLVAEVLTTTGSRRAAGTEMHVGMTDAAV